MYISYSVMRQISFLLFLGLLLGIATCDGHCPLHPTELSQLHSDGVHVMKNQMKEMDQNVSYQYSYTKPLNRHPSVAIGIHQFEADPSKVLGFEVNILKSTTAGILFDIVFNQNGHWKQMKMNFLSSTRKDLQLGVAEYQSQDSHSSERFALSYNFKHDWDTPYMKIKPLLCSIHLTSSNQYSLGIQLTHTQFVKGGVMFYFATNNTHVQHVKMNVIIFDAYNPSFRYADGSISQNYVYSKVMIQLPKHTIKQMRTFIFGLVSFDISISVPISLHTSVDKFYLQIGQDNKKCEINHITVNYLILSIFPKCGACEGYIYELNGKCVKSCPEGYRAVDGKCEEIKCRPGYYWDEAWSKCVKCEPGSKNRECKYACRYGFILKDQKCVPICTMPFEIYHENKCICMSGMHRINGKCDYCEEGTRYDHNSLTCKSICSNLSYYDKQYKRCMCIDGYHWVKGRCQTCPTGHIYNERWRQCIKPCGEHEYFNGLKCHCVNGYYMIEGKCGRCKYNQVYDTMAMVCRPRCKANEQLKGNECVCKWNWIRVNGICQPECGEFQYFNGLKCQCANSYYMVDGKCGRCPLNTVYVTKTMTCRPRCGAYEVWNGEKCVCQQGFQYINGVCKAMCGHYEKYDGEKCVCADGFYIINGKCGVCSSHQQYNPDQRKCVNICKPNQMFDGKMCVCMDGYYKMDGMCKMCGPNEMFDGKMCVCMDGYYKMNGMCKMCGPNEMFDGKMCVCMDGYYKMNGMCKMCGPNEMFDGKMCVCMDGYYKMNGMCKMCGPNEMFDGKMCVCMDGYYKMNGMCKMCGPNEMFDGKMCVCMDAYYRINGKCEKCKQNEIFSPLFSRCIPKCGMNEVYSEILGCICMDGFVEISGICTTCPEGTKYDPLLFGCLKTCPENEMLMGGKCECKQGYIRDASGVCMMKKCPENSAYNEMTQCCVCFDGYMLNPKTGECDKQPECPQNSERMNGRCVCKDGYNYDEKGMCVKCSANQMFDGLKCVCMSGYVRNENGMCMKIVIPTCKQNEMYDEQSKMCVCMKGYEMVKGQCKKIIVCGQKQYWNGEKCMCEEGYILKHGKCCKVEIPTPKCIYNSFFDGVKCVCNEGFFELSPGICATCPPLMWWNGKKCAFDKQCWIGYAWDESKQCCVPQVQICGQNGMWNGNQCTCKKTYNLINGVCQRCPAGSRYDGAKCSFAKGGQCLLPNEIVIGGQCVCEEGYNRYNGACIKCPSTSVWNGRFCQVEKVDEQCRSIAFAVIRDGKCECALGFRMVNAVCVPISFQSDGLGANAMEGRDSFIPSMTFENNGA